MRSTLKLSLLVFAVAATPAFAEDDDKIFTDVSTGNPLAERMTDRKRGDKIKVSVDGCVYEDVKFDEKERNSRFYDDINALFKKLVSLQAAAPCPDPGQKEFEYKLKHDRSTLTVTATGAEGSKTQTVVIGPKEHLYLGIDVPVTQTKQLKYDNSSQTLQPKSDPQIYLSFNVYAGDLAAKYDDQKWYEHFSAKFLFLPSSRPLDSFGLAAGYRLPDLKIIDLKSFSVFGGHFWTKQDAVTGETNASTARSWRVGLTYDLGAGLKWLK